MASLAIAAPASEEPPKEEAKQEDATDGQKPKKQSFNERISEVIHERNAAKQEAAEAKRESAELKARLEALSVQADPVKQDAEPQEKDFATQSDYIRALARHMAKLEIADREQQEADARAREESDALGTRWEQNEAIAKTEIDDYAEVLGEAKIQIKEYVHAALLRSKEGPKMAYFLAKNPDEVKKLNRMNPIDGIRYFVDLERDLLKPEKTEKHEPKPKPVERSRAPEPITPVKGGAAIDPGPASSFAEYRARRKASLNS